MADLIYKPLFQQ